MTQDTLGVPSVAPPSPVGSLAEPAPRPSSPPGGQLSRAQASAIFAENCDYVWNALRRLDVRSADLEDLTHDTFVAVFRQWESYDPSRPLRPWLFGFALRVASDHRRRARHRLEVQADSFDAHDPSPDAAQQLLTKERQSLARSALEAIEISRRAVFILHELDGCSVPELAVSLGIPLPTAYSRLRLAREDFAAALKRLAARAR